MRALIPIFCAVLLVLVPRAAAAYTFTDSVGDFRAPLDPAAGESVCVGIPTGAAEPSACKGVDINALGKFAGGQRDVTVAGVAMVRDPSGMTLFIALHTPGTANLQRADAFADGLERGVRASLPTGVRTLKNEHHTMTVAGRTALIVDVDFDIPAASPIHALFGHARYVDVAAGNVDYTLTFSGSLENAAKTNAIASRVIDKLSLAPASTPPTTTTTTADSPSRDTEKTSSHDTPASSDEHFRAGERVGRLIGFLIIPVLIIVGIVLAVRKKPQPAYPAAWYPPPGLPSPGIRPAGKSTPGVRPSGIPARRPTGVSTTGALDCAYGVRSTAVALRAR